MHWNGTQAVALIVKISNTEQRKVDRNVQPSINLEIGRITKNKSLRTDNASDGNYYVVYQIK